MPDINEGPTTVGAIVGKMRMDLTEWTAGKERVKADVDEIRGLSPKISIQTNAAAVIAELEAVKRAQSGLGGVTVTTTVKSDSTAGTDRVRASTDALAAAELRLSAAEEASESATARATIAQMRLKEMQDKGARSAAALAAAEEATRSAIAKSELAATRAALAEEALQKAQKKAAETAAANAAANEAVAASNRQVESSGRGASGFWHKIAVGIALIGPMLIPMTAAAVGAATAFGAMGGAGVLAVKGIEREMQEGTRLGKQYSSGLNTLKGDLSTLERTAAAGVLAPFERTVKQIHGLMPNLNQEVGFFSGILGDVGGHIITGLAKGLHTVEPLLEDIGVGVDEISVKFEDFATNGGLQSWASYAQRTLPDVVHTIEDVGGAVTHIITALQPLATSGLAVVRGLSDTVKAIPVPVLTAVAAGLTAGYVASKLWGAGATMLGKVSDVIRTIGARMTITAAATRGQSAAFVETAGTAAAAAGAEDVAAASTRGLGLAIDAAAGPVGWIIGGLAALVGAIAASAGSTEDATQTQDDYTQALKSSHGAIDQNVRDITAKKLADEGALDIAKRYHLTLSTVTDAVLGNADAQKKVTDAAKKYGMVMSTTNRQQFETGQGQKVLSSDAQKLIDTTNGLNDSFNKSVKKQKEIAAASKDTSKAQKDQSSTTKSQIADFNDLSDSADDAGDSINDLKDKIDGFGSSALDVSSAERDFQQAVDDAASSVKKNGKTLDDNTAKGRANSQALDEIARNAIQLAGAEAEVDSSGKKSAKTLETGRKAFINAAEAAGMSAKAANKLADQYGLIPSNVKTKISTSGSSGAKKDADKVRTAVVKIPGGKTVKVKVSGAAAAKGALDGIRASWFSIPNTKVVNVVDHVRSVMVRAAGGAVSGPGSATSDSIPAMLSNGEHVLTAADVGRMGGQAGVYAFRRALESGLGPLQAAAKIAGTVSSPSEPAAAASGSQRPVVQHFYLEVHGQQDPETFTRMVMGQLQRRAV